MSPSAEKDAATLTDKEIELREWLRSQPGGAERWTVIKAGFRSSYDMGLRDARRPMTHPPAPTTKETPMSANIQIVPMDVNCPVCFARAGQSCQERDGFKEPAHVSRQIAAVAALATGEYARLLAPKPGVAR